MISILNEKNSEFEVLDITDEKFSKYGRIIDPTSYKNYMQYINLLSVPEEGNLYIGNDAILFSVGSDSSASDIFGGVPLQYGFVNGNNSKVNSLEYHKSSEINAAVTPLVLFLGVKDDVKDNEYNTNQLEVFYLPEGTVIELYPNVLHFSPCKVQDEGFKCGVILPQGTNMEFVKSVHKLNDEDQLLFKTNKWILSHKEHEAFVLKGAVPGLKGKNYELKY